MARVSRLRARIIKVSTNIAPPAPIFLPLSFLPSPGGPSPTYSPSTPTTRSKGFLVELTRFPAYSLRRGSAGPTAEFRLEFAIRGARLAFPWIFIADSEKVALGTPFLGCREQIVILRGLYRFQLLVLILALTSTIQIRFIYLAHKAHHFIVIRSRAMSLSRFLHLFGSFLS